MLIIIEDGLSLKQERGVGQYTKRLYEMLNEIYQVKMNRKRFLENINNSIIRRILYILWLNTFFILKLLFINQKTICFFPSTITPFIKLKKTKYISTIHDIRSVKYPELSTKIQNIHANFANWSALKFADKILTVSQTIKLELLQHYKLNENNINVIYNTFSLNNILYDKSENILEKLNIKSNEYLLFVGGLDKNKNINMTISAFEKISKIYKNLKLIIVGKVGNDNILSNNPQIIFAGFISNEDIKVLYKNALIYLFPSIYEGFGIPIIDAQLLQTPVICSNIPVFKEVAGDGALFCDLNIDSLTEKITILLNSKNLREKCINQGLINKDKFCFDKIKNQMELLISEY